MRRGAWDVAKARRGKCHLIGDTLVWAGADKLWVKSLCFGRVGR